MRRLLALLLILFPLVSFAAAQVFLEGMLIQPSVTDTRLTFILSDKTYGKVKYFPATNRLVIEFANTYKRFNLQNTSLGTAANVRTINTQEAGDVLRFIFTVSGKVHWTTSFLPSSSGSGVRLQLEIISDKKTVKTAPKITLNKVAVIKAQKTPHEFTVVIDAGHGGKDSGARGLGGTEEKNIVLSIAKILQRKITAEFASQPLRVVLTRNGDYFVPLRQRLKLARKGKADLFIAIHADAYFERNATGASVYALSQHGASNEATRWLAQQENYSELGGVALNHLQDRDPMLRSVLVDLAQTATIQDSIRLGSKVLGALDSVSSLHYNHVERAPFMVLKSPDIPSVLVETGFITNPFEEKRLSDSGYQEKIAQALLDGIRLYLREYAVKGE